MPAQKPLVAAAVALLIGVSAALRIESFYRMSFRQRPAPAAPSGSRTAEPAKPFSLRMVDSGGIGIPIDGRWGDDYSHDRRTFREVIRQDPPYVDAEAFKTTELEWRSYVDRMIRYGHNAMAVPLLLELIDFDRVDRKDETAHAHGVYDRESPFLARHAAVRHSMRPLFEWTARRGMQVFLDTDMLTLTPPLYEFLRQVAPSRGSAGIDATNPRVWEIYRAGLEELFDKLPAVAGVVIRFGEGGSLYGSDGWPYRSEVDVRDAASLRAMLRGLLPVFEAKHKTLVLRSWTVGIGSLGRLHVDPKIYSAVLGDITSPALIVSTKVNAGDFFSYLPLNPTLESGPHRRLIELQAKPEFEGFGAFPDFLGEEYADALNELRHANPNIAGTFLFTQFGGPLRAGPRTLYPLHGFWLWTDANVFVASKLALDPGADVGQLLKQWAAANFPDARVADAVADALVLTRSAVLDGFYIRPFAERQVMIGPLELPPLMWIFEWKMVGGWNSLLSLVYHGSRDSVALSIEQGRAAADKVRQARRQLRRAIDATAPGVCATICDQALRSLEYQESLFDVLAWWRQAFLSYYSWIDTGDRGSWNEWRAGKAGFENAAALHAARFGRDELFPAFDLGSARQAVATASHTTWIRLAAAAMLAALVASLMIGSRTAAELTVVLVVGSVLRMLTDFRSARIAAGPAIVITAFAIVFATAITGQRHDRRRADLLLAAVGPMFPIALLVLAAIAYGGPLGVWYWFWMSRPFRVVLFSVAFATMPWTAYSMYMARPGERWSVRIGGILAATGAAIVSLLALLPNW